MQSCPKGIQWLQLLVVIPTILLTVGCSTPSHIYKDGDVIISGVGDPFEEFVIVSTFNTGHTLGDGWYMRAVVGKESREVTRQIVVRSSSPSGFERPLSLTFLVKGKPLSIQPSDSKPTAKSYSSGSIRGTRYSYSSIYSIDAELSESIAAAEENVRVRQKIEGRSYDVEMDPAEARDLEKGIAEVLISLK
jgi:hypothetical protein